MKKIGTYFLMGLIVLMLVAQGVSAGDESDPEIRDDEKDVQSWIFFKGPFSNFLFKHIDIVSCWFFEDSAEPDMFYVTLKVREFRFSLLNTTYAVQWYYNDVWCYCLMNVGRNGAVQSARVGYFNGTIEYRNETVFAVDEAKNTVTITVPKACVCNPGLGAVLTDPFAAAILLPNSEKVLNLFPLVSLVGSDDAIEGRDYSIEY